MLKQNRVLLIFLGILFVLALAFLLPGYFDCYGPHWWPKSIGEAEAESAELNDLSTVWRQNARKDGIINVEVDHETVTIKVRDGEPVSTLRTLPLAWEESYARHHHLNAATAPCLRIIVRNERGEILSSGVNRNSVYRLWVDDYIWHGTNSTYR